MLKYLAPLVLFFGAPNIARAQDYKAEIAQAERLGQTLYNYDSAAWGATDAVFGDEEIKTAFLEAPIGYVSLDNGNGTFSTGFIVESENGPVIKIDVQTKGKTALDVKFHETSRPLGTEEAKYLKARELVLKASFEPCAEFLPMNLNIIPSGDGALYVYLMSATKNPGVIVYGRHYRFRIEDNQVSETIAFTNSCLGIPIAENAAGSFITHIKTPYPQEHHVFASLSHGLPIFVGTSNNDKVWAVEGSAIREVEK